MSAADVPPGAGYVCGKEEECRHGPLGCTANSATHRESIPPFAYVSRNGLDQGLALFSSQRTTCSEARRCVPAGGAQGVPHSRRGAPRPRNLQSRTSVPGPRPSA